MKRAKKHFFGLLIVCLSLILPIKGYSQLSEKLFFGSHGELHFNDQVQYVDGKPASGELDFQKIIFSAGYKIDKHWSVASKLKIEHAFDSKYSGGDVWIDNFYVKYKHTDKFVVQAGLISVPLNGGNPKVYGSVVLSPVEKYLEFSWREAGVAFSGSFDKKFSYKATLSTGINPAELHSKSGIYGARNSEFSSSTSNAALGAQFKFNPVSNIQLGTSFLYSGLENSADYSGDLSGANYRVNELFASYQYKLFGIRSVAVYSAVNESQKINEAFNNKVGSSQLGGLLEFSYDLSQVFGTHNAEQHFSVILRGEYYDTHYRTSGISDNSKYEHTDYTLGFVYKPFSFLELKADYQLIRIGGHADNQMLNIGIGYDIH